MESSNPTAGSEPIPNPPTPGDGLTPSDDSPPSNNETTVEVTTTQSQVPATTDDDPNLAAKWSDLTQEEAATASDAMGFMGISKRKARKILKIRGAGKYLRRGVQSAIGLSMECPALEDNRRAQKAFTRMVADKKLDTRLRIEAGKALAALQETMRRVVDSSIVASEKFDEAQKPVQQNQAPTVQVGVNINNMPPVAKPNARANDGAALLSPIPTDG